MNGEGVTVTVLGVEDARDTIRARPEGSFTVVVDGSCGDEALPVQAHSELRVDIAMANAVARFTLWSVNARSAWP